MIREYIKKSLLEIAGTLGADVSPDIDIPANSAHGDYTTSMALKLSGKLKKKPMDIAISIKEKFPTDGYVSRVETVAPGFVNFRISEKYLSGMLKEAAAGNFEFPQFHLGPEKKIMVEFAHPNTHKLFHIGHLRNISTGESVVRIFEAVGNKVIRTNYQGDVGLHIAKCLYGIRSSKHDLKKLGSLQEKIEFIGKMYTEGTKAYEDDPKAKEEVLKINKMIYDQSPEIIPLWKETRQWSLDYYEETYKRLYSHFDRLYFESDVTKRGLEITKEIFEKGVLEKSQGAVVFNGKKYGLDTRVFINSLGFPTYEGKEMGLAEKEFSDFGVLDKDIHVVTPEQTSFFKVTFKVEEIIDEKKFKNRQYHLIYEWVKLKEGKMSSRTGNIIEANWLIDQIKEKILKTFKCDKETAETLAVASVKYSFLKNSTSTVIAFDIDESIAVNGNSAPYLNYSYVRCLSILKKNIAPAGEIPPVEFNQEESDIIRVLYRFPGVVLKSASSYSPNVIAAYLYELASQFSIFYQKSPILKAENDKKVLRLAIVRAVANTMKKGLDLLGIKTVEKM